MFQKSPNVGSGERRNSINWPRRKMQSQHSVQWPTKNKIQRWYVCQKPVLICQFLQKPCTWITNECTYKPYILYSQNFTHCRQIQCSLYWNIANINMWYSKSLFCWHLHVLQYLPRPASSFGCGLSIKPQIYNGKRRSETNNIQYVVVNN